MEKWMEIFGTIVGHNILCNQFYHKHNNDDIVFGTYALKYSSREDPTELFD